MSQFRNATVNVPTTHTVGGQTLEIDVPQRVREVRQPLDLDAIVAGAVSLITVLVVLGALSWSTVAIGTLLHRMAPAWVSYLVAVVFDMSWVACMGAEWLMRYDGGRRVWTPRIAGLLALVVSVLTILLEGDLTSHSLVIGAAGAAISVLAKGLWTVMMMISTRRLSDLDRLWYAKASSGAGAELAMTAIQRKLARVQARAARERQALGIPEPAPAALPESVPAPESAPVQSVPQAVPASGSATVSGSVPAVAVTRSAPASGSVPAAPVRIPVPQPVRSGSAPAGLGTVLDRVWIRIRSGMDPDRDRDAILADIVAEDPAVNQETVRRMTRTARNALTSQQTAQLPANP